MKKKRITGLLLATVGLSACRHHPNIVSEQTIPHVTVVHPEIGALTDTIIAAGVITTIDQSDLSFKTGGTVEQVYFEEGDFVRKGQLLARLNTVEYRSQIDQVDYKIEQYLRDIKRLNILVKDTIATIEQLQNAETALVTARAQKKALMYNLAQSEIYAPVDGVILNKQINQGEYKASGALAFTLGSNDGSNNRSWIFKAGLSDRDRLRLKLNGSIKLTLDALPEKQFDGQIYKLSSIPDAVTLTYDCYIRFDPQQVPVVYGLTGKLIIPVRSEESCIMLPLEAVTKVDDGIGVIYTVSDQSVAVRSEVKLLSVSRDKVILATALRPAERVIVAGNSIVEDGVKVQIENVKNK